MKPSTTVVVCGFGRCGTSMVMRMLHTAGVPVIADSYSSYEYHEMERPHPVDWSRFAGHAIKVIDPQRWQFQPHHDLRFIFLSRDPKQQAKSQEKLHMFRVTAEHHKAIVASLRRDYKFVSDVFGRHPMLHLRFEQILAKPQIHAQRIAEFLGGDRELSVMALRMASIVVSRKPQCLTDLSFEMELIASAPSTPRPTELQP